MSTYAKIHAEIGKDKELHKPKWLTSYHYKKSGNCTRIIEVKTEQLRVPVQETGYVP